MAIQSHLLTYDDLERMRETRDERLELIEGEMVVTPSPSPMHQLVVHRLAVLSDRAIVETGFGVVLESPLDVYLMAQNVFQPDRIVLLRDRFTHFGSNMVESAPNLTIEVICPSSRGYDRVIKRNVYARFGVHEFWLVDPDTRTITVFSDPREGRYQTETVASDVAVSATIPGVSVDLEALFAPVPGF
ncbi:MAG: Uma2 family endonuclease [Chloroflexota bacterium]|nr:Uma2 family endonuclease [Chloroflexota bacterium]